MPENNRFNDEEVILENRVIKEDALKRPRVRKNRRRAVVYTLMVVAALAAFFVLVFTVFFKIKKIDIVGTERYGVSDIEQYGGIRFGAPLYGFDSLGAETALTEALPYIKEVEVTRSIPSTVRITVTEETPAFALRVENDDYILSDDFKVLERVPAGESPDELVFLSAGTVADCMVGSELSFAEKKLLDSFKTLWQTLQTYSLCVDIDYIEAAERFDIYFGYKGRIRVYLGDVKDCDAKIRFFIKIMEHIYDEQTGLLDLSDKKEATFSPYDTN